MLPALVAGAWNEENTADCEAVERLTGVPYEQWKPTLVRWSHESDPPVRQIGDVWAVVAREDMWDLLKRYLTRDHLERFQAVALAVLGAPDPRYNLPTGERWLAPIRDAVPRHSRHLREGLADAVALLGARGGNIVVGTAMWASSYAAEVVRQLLEHASDDWRLWASLSLWLPLFAEGAPEAFLEAVQQGVRGDEPVLRHLFVESGDTLFGDSPYADLLSALETLAWSPDHLGQAAHTLAKLARLDPRDESGNHPLRSLLAVFHRWFPQTAAPLERRLRVIDTLRERAPDVAWRLLCRLIEPLETGHPTRRPKRRGWAPDAREFVPAEEEAQTIREVAQRLLADVGASASRWQELIAVLPWLPEEYFEAAVDRLAAMDGTSLTSADRAQIWHALRKLISRHRSFPEAPWAMRAQRVERLEQVFPRFVPTDLVGLYGWLFEHAPALPQGREGDWHAHQQAVGAARLDAVRAVYTQAGLAGLLELARQVEAPGYLGLTLGASDLTAAEEDDLLGGHLAANEPARALFARGFVGGRIRGHGQRWAEQKWAEVAPRWSPAQRGELLFALPGPVPRTFLEDADPDTQHHYWRLASPYGIPRGEDEWAVRKFLEHDRPYAAIELLGGYAGDAQAPPADLVAEALERVLRSTPEDDRASQLSGHYVEQLLDLLARSDVVDRTRVARLEWAFLTVLPTTSRPPKVLHAGLARDPALFADVLARAHPPEGDEQHDVTPEEQPAWLRAYQLLDSWRTVPGTREGGRIDVEALREWLRQARDQARAIGRPRVADRIIGRVLSEAPPESDGIWPPRPVRDVIEEVESPDLERGFLIGVHTSRGTVSKAITEGGAQERALADRYEAFAAQIVDDSPKTAAVLRRIADAYRTEAMREDQRAQLREDLYGW